MATSNVQIANFALTMIAADNISSLTEETEEARRVNTIFHILRDELLEEFPWPFAVTRTSLATLDETPSHQFNYVFQLPSDCHRYLDKEYPKNIHRIEGSKLLTNEDSVNIRYIKYITDPVQFSAGFASALALRIALTLSYSITGKQTYTERLEKLHTASVLKAKGVQSQSSGTAKSLDDNTWLGSRSSGGGFPPTTTIADE